LGFGAWGLGFIFKYLVYVFDIWFLIFDFEKGDNK